jgi:hypothetical protein
MVGQACCTLTGINGTASDRAKRSTWGFHSYEGYTVATAESDMCLFMRPLRCSILTLVQFGLI